MKWAAIAVLLCGCDRFYGLEFTDCPAIGADLDGDGIDDGCDPCIAPASDATADFDGDTVANGSDVCPFDTPGDPTDSDGDGTPDLCDPFPNAPDERRCLMMFTSPTLTAKLWTPALGGNGLSVLSGSLHADATSERLASEVTESVEDPGAATAYEVVYDTTPLLATTGHFAVLPRVAGTQFRGCQVDINQTTGVVQLSYVTDAETINSKSDVLAPGVTGDVSVALTAQIILGPTDDTIECDAFAVSGGATVVLDTSGTSPDLPGNLGLANQIWATDVLGIEIFDER